jgi:uncharacterized protein (TIGR02118 family)
MICITAIYPAASGTRFDAGYYHRRHTPFAVELLRPFDLIRLCVSEGIAALDGSPPPYRMISEMYFASREMFDAAFAACGEALFADAANFTDIEPVLQVSGGVIDVAFDRHDFGVEAQ